MNKIKKMVLIGILVLIYPLQIKAVNIVPQPTFVSEKPGEYIIKNAISIDTRDKISFEKEYLNDLLKTEFLLNPSKTRSPKDKGIRILINKNLGSELGNEGYRLQVTETGILLEAPNPAGIFYSIQTLRQLLKKEDGIVKAGYIKIIDQPRFSWRSFMLDESRYFKGKTIVKKLLDEMAVLKMNTFHWHLTDDQGWRIEIKKYPELTKTGGRRDSTQTGGWNSKKYDHQPHQGFYNQADIKEIVQYAAERHITIVPEIEMPGHATAAIASYPWLGVTKQPVKVSTKFGVMYDIFDVTDPRVMKFLQDILSEITTLFPFNVIHIGGDEVKYDQWAQSPAVKTFMKKNSLASPADLQIFFTNKMSNFLEKKNKRMLGWNDIMGAKLHDYNLNTLPASGTLSKSAIVQFWKGNLEMIREATSNGYDIVNSYHELTYLDYDTSLEKSYSFDPIPEGLDKKFHSRILGSGCQMWSEWIPTAVDMYPKIFPRLAAYAEIGWSQKENKNFNRFQNSLPYFFSRWDKEGINVKKN